MNQASVRMGIFGVEYLRPKNKKTAIHLFPVDGRISRVSKTRPTDPSLQVVAVGAASNAIHDGV
jgi:hypothetical protein